MNTPQPTASVRNRGVCAPDPDAWFPAPSDATAIQTAKTACLRCPLIHDCLMWAITQNVEDGVWGGLSDRERRSLRRRTVKRSNATVDLATAVAAAVDRAYDGPRAPHHNTLAGAYRARTVPESGGHTRWTAAHRTVHFQGKIYTAAQLAFRMGHGRPAEGRIHVTCGRPGCLTPSHLADARVRAENAPRKPPTKKQRPHLTPNQMIEQYAHPTHDGHFTWSGPDVYRHERRRYTSRQLAFHIGHGRLPRGVVRTNCGRGDCIAPRHLVDDQLRARLARPSPLAAAA